eukprot:6492890-Pyramimonas_sp.AAC.1
MQSPDPPALRDSLLMWIRKCLLGAAKRLGVRGYHGQGLPDFMASFSSPYPKMGVLLLLGRLLLPLLLPSSRTYSYLDLLIPRLTHTQTYSYSDILILIPARTQTYSYPG